MSFVVRPPWRAEVGGLEAGCYLAAAKWAGGRRWECYYSEAGVLVLRYDQVNWLADHWEWFPGSGPFYGETEGLLQMGMKYISKVMSAQRAKSGKAAYMDPELGRDRPALTEFMVSTEGADGKPRARSCLMLAVDDDGVRVGLKDEDAGGWCWRSGQTLQEALGALEKALADGTARFGGHNARAARKGR